MEFDTDEDSLYGEGDEEDENDPVGDHIPIPIDSDRDAQDSGQDSSGFSTSETVHGPQASPTAFYSYFLTSASSFPASGLCFPASDLSIPASSSSAPASGSSTPASGPSSSASSV